MVKGVITRLIIGLVGLVLIGILIFAFRDAFLTKSDASDLLANQHIELINKFELLKSESSSALSDYSRMIEMKISSADNRRISSAIRQSAWFNTKGKDAFSFFPHYVGPIRNQYVVTNYAVGKTLYRDIFFVSDTGYSTNFTRVEVCNDTLRYRQVVE